MFWILALLIAYILVDVNYFIRATVNYILAKMRPRLKSPIESSEIYGICLPSDADYFIVHMNNGRYLREFDFARFDLGTRNGILERIWKRGGTFPMVAATIRYRLPLYIFSVYKIVTTPLWWDEKYLYFDQRVITLHDNIVRTVAFTKLAIISKVNCEELIQELFPGSVKPRISPELQAWMVTNEMSSDSMKLQKTNNIKSD